MSWSELFAFFFFFSLFFSIFGTSHNVQSGDEGLNVPEGNTPEEKKSNEFEMAGDSQRPTE